MSAFHLYELALERKLPILDSNSGGLWTSSTYTQSESTLSISYMISRLQMWPNPCHITHQCSTRYTGSQLHYLPVQLLKLIMTSGTLKATHAMQSTPPSKSWTDPQIIY